MPERLFDLHLAPFTKPSLASKDPASVTKELGVSVTMYRLSDLWQLEPREAARSELSQWLMLRHFVSDSDCLESEFRGAASTLHSVLSLLQNPSTSHIYVPHYTHTCASNKKRDWPEGALAPRSRLAAYVTTLGHVLGGCAAAEALGSGLRRLGLVRRLRFQRTRLAATNALAVVAAAERVWPLGEALAAIDCMCKNLRAENDGNSADSWPAAALSQWLAPSRTDDTEDSLAWPPPAGDTDQRAASAAVWDAPEVQVALRRALMYSAAAAAAPPSSRAQPSWASYGWTPSEIVAAAVAAAQLRCCKPSWSAEGASASGDTPCRLNLEAAVVSDDFAAWGKPRCEHRITQQHRDQACTCRPALLA